MTLPRRAPRRTLPAPARASGAWEAARLAKAPRKLAAGRDAALMRRLADRRELGAADVARLSPGARELLDQWTEDGWVQPLEV